MVGREKEVSHSRQGQQQKARREQHPRQQRRREQQRERTKRTARLCRRRQERKEMAEQEHRYARPRLLSPLFPSAAPTSQPRRKTFMLSTSIPRSTRSLGLLFSLLTWAPVNSWQLYLLGTLMMTTPHACHVLGLMHRTQGPNRMLRGPHHGTILWDGKAGTGGLVLEPTEKNRKSGSPPSMPCLHHQHPRPLPFPSHPRRQPHTHANGSCCFLVLGWLHVACG